MSVSKTLAGDDWQRCQSSASLWSPNGYETVVKQMNKKIHLKRI